MSKNRISRFFEIPFALASKVASCTLLTLIRAYQLLLSPVIPPCCRYVPSCSRYTQLAIREWGPLRGMLLGLWRVLRCHPFSRSGFDPVPKKGTIL